VVVANIQMRAHFEDRSRVRVPCEQQLDTGESVPISTLAFFLYIVLYVVDGWLVGCCGLGNESSWFMI